MWFWLLININEWNIYLFHFYAIVMQFAILDLTTWNDVIKDSFMSIWCSSTIAIVCVSTAHCSVVILKIDRWFARKKTGSKLVWKMVEKAFKSFDRTLGCSHFYSNLTFLWSIFVEFSRCIYHYVHIDGGVVRFFVADAWYV